MKKSILLGVLALMMVMFAVPVMAVDSASTQIEVSGVIECIPSLAISSDISSVDFGTMYLGENYQIEIGTLHVQSQCTAWSVGAPASSPDVYGYMSGDAGTLNNPLFQKDINQADAFLYITDFPAGSGWSGFDGVYTEQLWDFAYPLSYMQNVTEDDVPGAYGVSLTYTVSAV